MTTKSTNEAMALLKAYRRDLIDKGREIADELITKYGQTHSRQVRDVMEKRGLLDKEKQVKGYWLGAVFNCTKFEWTGAWFKYSCKAHNVHERTIKVWRLM